MGKVIIIKKMKNIVAVAGTILISVLGVTRAEEQAGFSARTHASPEEVTFIADDKFIYNHDEWKDAEEVTSAKKIHDLRHEYKPYDHKKRPVYGVLTEPIRGTLKKGEKETVENANVSYVPRSHVQFLEQAGV